MKMTDSKICTNFSRSFIFIIILVIENFELKVSPLDNSLIKGNFSRYLKQLEEEIFRLLIGSRIWGRASVYINNRYTTLYRNVFLLSQNIGNMPGASEKLGNIIPRKRCCASVRI